MRWDSPQRGVDKIKYKGKFQNKGKAEFEVFSNKNTFWLVSFQIWRSKNQNGRSVGASAPGYNHYLTLLMLLSIPRAPWWMAIVRLNGRTSLYICVHAFGRLFCFCYYVCMKYSACMLGEKKERNGPAGVWNKSPVSKTIFHSPPPRKINWLNESCLL